MELATFGFKCSSRLVNSLKHCRFAQINYPILTKHKSILKLITSLYPKVKDKLIQPVNYWDGDLCAVGYRRNNKIVYISSYFHLEENPIRYDLDLEIINPNKTEDYEVIKSYKGLSEIEVIKEINTYFALGN